jgi:hypothetical protein
MTYFSAVCWYQYYCINYRAALKADIGTQVVADDPYFGGKVSFFKYLLNLFQTIPLISRTRGIKAARSPMSGKKISREILVKLLNIELIRPEMKPLKVHKIEIFFGFDFEICIISLLVTSKY